MNNEDERTWKEAVVACLMQPPIQWVPGALSLGVKGPRREADHSPPSSAEVKKAWSYASTPPIRLQGLPVFLFFFTL
jgi:hypothetical protein